MAGNREGTGRSSSSDAFSTLSAIVVLVRLHGFGIQGVVGLHLHRWAPTEVYAVVGVHLDRWARTHAGTVASHREVPAPVISCLLACLLLASLPSLLLPSPHATYPQRRGGGAALPPKWRKQPRTPRRVVLKAEAASPPLESNWLPRAHMRTSPPTRGNPERHSRRRGNKEEEGEEKPKDFSERRRKKSLYPANPGGAPETTFAFASQKRGTRRAKGGTRTSPRKT